MSQNDSHHRVGKIDCPFVKPRKPDFGECDGYPVLAYGCLVSPRVTSYSIGNRRSNVNQWTIDEKSAMKTRDKPTEFTVLFNDKLEFQSLTLVVDGSPLVILSRGSGYGDDGDMEIFQTCVATMYRSHSNDAIACWNDDCSEFCIRCTTKIGVAMGTWKILSLSRQFKIRSGGEKFRSWFESDDPWHVLDLPWNNAKEHFG